MIMLMMMMMMMMMIMMIGKKTLFHELYTVSEDFRYLGTELNLCWGVFRDSVYRYLGSGHCEVAITDPFPDRYIKRRAKGAPIRVSQPRCWCLL